MKHLSILVPEGQYNLTSIIMPYEAFNRANAQYERAGKLPVFKIEVVGSHARAGVHNDTFSIQPNADYNTLTQSDLILIPGVDTRFVIDDLHRFSQSLETNNELVEWVKKQYKNGAEVGSMCTGTFLLAKTGLLDGKQCSTHWRVSDVFKKMFPKVDLRDDKIITMHNGVYTTGGALSSMNLVLHLIEKYYDRETAIYIAKIFELDMNRNSQLPFAMFKAQKEHNDLVIKNAQEFIEDNVEQKISVEILADKFAIGRRHFERRFKKATRNTPIEYIQRVKIEAAKQKLETGRENINEVMYGIGYSDITAFRSIFKKITGLTPMEYRTRYNKEAAN